MYIKYESDPVAYRTMGGHHQIVTCLAHAAARLNKHKTTYYTYNDTHVIHPDYLGKIWVNDTLVQENDNGLHAKVHCHCCLLEDLKSKESQLSVLEDCITDMTLKLHANMCHLARAEAIDHIEKHCGTMSCILFLGMFKLGRPS